eukprot:CAMPEP_0198226688 /NCGR_PEP_ID=MMETSP1445-20131203/106184_1 /TAXON_ID=36898 /ORGANISM="Pyramimonas sp., Strain CCMP2087" /LENGTH=160 /DNA_ID=CAMNT_0043906551 /DNA_START=501 /DNA_END=980 /DNA_ORIENTATION=+
MKRHPIGHTWRVFSKTGILLLPRSEYSQRRMILRRRVSSSCPLASRRQVTPQAAFRLNDPEDPSGKRKLTPRQSRLLAKRLHAMPKINGIKEELEETLKGYPNGIPLAHVPMALRKMTRERQAAALGVESVRKAYSKIIHGETEKPDRLMQKAMAGVGYE